MWNCFWINRFLNWGTLFWDFLTDAILLTFNHSTKSAIALITSHFCASQNLTFCDLAVVAAIKPRYAIYWYGINFFWNIIIDIVYLSDSSFLFVKINNDCLILITQYYVNHDAVPDAIIGAFLDNLLQFKFNWCVLLKGAFSIHVFSFTLELIIEKGLRSHFFPFTVLRPTTFRFDKLNLLFIGMMQINRHLRSRWPWFGSHDCHIRWWLCGCL